LVEAQQGTYSFSWLSLSQLFILDYLDRDTKWRDDGYPKNDLIRYNKKPEEIHLTYDGATKTVTLHNPTSNASYHIVY
jgi:hypothetical protein